MTSGSAVVNRWVIFRHEDSMTYGKCVLIDENNSLKGFLKVFRASSTARVSDVWLISSLGTVVRVHPKPDCMVHPRPIASNVPVPEDAHQCANCYDVIGDIEDAQCVNSEMYCPDCYSDLFAMCERCEDSVSVDDLTEVRVSESRRRARTEQWCDVCSETHATRCDDCRDHVTESTRVSGSDVCQACLEDGDYSYCESCQETVHSDNTVYVRDEVYCRDCAPNSSEHIHEAHYAPRPIFHGDRSKIHYGIELEVSADLEDAEDVIDVLGGEDHVYLKEDGSVSDGFEIVTHPHTLDAHRDIWTDFFDANFSGLTANYHGMHVHIERKHLTKLQIGKMDVFVNSEVNKDFIHAIAGRDPRQWASLDHSRTITDGDSGDKYVAVNLKHHSTVEIRIFRGTTARARFFSNLEFCDALVSFTKNASIRALDYRSFSNYVRRYRKLYRNLDAHLVENGYLYPLRARTIAA